jgi:hypothetical protein
MPELHDSMLWLNAERDPVDDAIASAQHCCLYVATFYPVVQMNFTDSV